MDAVTLLLFEIDDVGCVMELRMEVVLLEDWRWAVSSRSSREWKSSRLPDVLCSIVH